MPFFTRFRPSRPPTPPPSSPTTKTSSPWQHIVIGPTPPPTRSPSPLPQKRPSLISSTSWDISTFPSTSPYYPGEQNGDWRTSTVDVIKHPSALAGTVNEALSWPHLRNSLAEVIENTSEVFQGSLNHIFEGRDVPAMHDRVMALIPRVSTPSLKEVGRRVDGMMDWAQEVMWRRRSVNFVEEEMASDYLSLAYWMGVKARRALVRQGICREWQVDARESVEWRAELDAALSILFKAEKSASSVEQMFSMTPIWNGDVDSKTWKLELDTGMTQIVFVGESNEWEEKRVCLSVAFTLPESVGRVRVEDVERETIDQDDWMAVE